MRLKHRDLAVRLAAGAAALSAWLCGCATDPLGAQRMARYRPDIEASDRSPWELRAANRGETGTEAVVPSPAAVTNGSASPESVPRAGTRRLKRGDRIVIYLRSIPTPHDIQDEIDDSGSVNLDLIGTVHLEGATTSDAERMIEKAYIDGKFYTQITVIVVSQADEYYVRGEIKSPGKYPLTGDMTLLMAISAAGGYTDFANPRKITIYRGSDVHRFNSRKIEDRKDEDPLIESGDIVVVARAVFGIGPL